MEKITKIKFRKWLSINKLLLLKLNIYQSIDGYGFNEKQPKNTKIKM